ncbi:MAG: hypothetical protein RMI79_04035 [Nitrososphaerota archaeon]|nr:hypothetical protein [Nitrososphaerota archaeon]
METRIIIAGCFVGAGIAAIIGLRADLPYLPMHLAVLRIFPPNIIVAILLAYSDRTLAYVILFIIGVFLGFSLVALTGSRKFVMTLGYMIPEVIAYLLATKYKWHRIGIWLPILLAAGVYEVHLISNSAS